MNTSYDISYAYEGTLKVYLLPKVGMILYKYIYNIYRYKDTGMICYDIYYLVIPKVCYINIYPG